MDETCAAACRKPKIDGVAAKREASPSAVREVVTAAPPRDATEADPLEEALDNLRIVRAVLRDEGPPADTVATLTKRRDELVDRIGKLREAATPVEVSVIDELTQSRSRTSTGFWLLWCRGRRRFRCITWVWCRIRIRRVLRRLRRMRLI